MVVALDLSLTATGWARISGSWSSREVGTIRPRARGVERLQYLLNGITPIARGAELVVLEGYAFARPNQAHQLGELGGVIRLGLHQLRVPFVEVPPSCLKKVATGKGNAPKEIVLVEAVRRLEYDGADHNVADALWLLAMASIHYGFAGAPQLPRAHLEGMAKVKWPELRKAA